ncbi:hypothetical protein CAEBREN_28908 [Caenorhabditis brenneri]|uniref:Uncharacterized protein n=1 Tax=Caenorhabditis brenneri TaxID=135651 RepID=G0N8A4_CAEBE|nr:hypothetical protein CAEBREN_28908 [Caenorhabditis brenneri]
MGCVMSQTEEDKKSTNDTEEINTEAVKKEIFPEEFAEIRLRVKHVHFANNADLHLIPFKWQEEEAYTKTLRKKKEPFVSNGSEFKNEQGDAISSDSPSNRSGVSCFSNQFIRNKDNSITV